MATTTAALVPAGTAVAAASTLATAARAIADTAVAPFPTITATLPAPEFRPLVLLGVLHLLLGGGLVHLCPLSLEHAVTLQDNLVPWLVVILLHKGKATLAPRVLLGDQVDGEGGAKLSEVVPEVRPVHVVLPTPNESFLGGDLGPWPASFFAGNGPLGLRFVDITLLGPCSLSVVNSVRSAKSDEAEPAAFPCARVVHHHS